MRLGVLVAESTVLPIIAGIIIVILIITIILRRFNQQPLIAYILGGMLVGPFGIGLVKDANLVSSLGTIGIVLLLFFIGMHISLPNLISKWRIAIFGTLFQIFLSIFCVVILGKIFDWPIQLVILIGFIISLSSSAVVLKILDQWKELKTKIGQNVLAILIVQDIAVIPMIILINFLGGESFNPLNLSLNVIGILVIFILVLLAVMFGRKIPIQPKDKQVQVLVALAICFGLAGLTSLFGISPALGAFAGGIIVASMRQTTWISESLESFHMVFVSLFFIYIGMIINLKFIWENVFLVISLVFVVFFVNMFINAVILKALGDSWKESIYAGALLAQVGEFSFLLAEIGFKQGIVTDHIYQATIAMIALSLLFSPFWVQMWKKILHISKNYKFELLSFARSKHHH